MTVRLAFLHTPDERFVVLCEPTAEPAGPRLSVTIYEHENVFLARAATSGLRDRTTIDIVTAVLLSVSTPTVPHRWLPLDLSRADRTALGLDAPTAIAPTPVSATGNAPTADAPTSLAPTSLAPTSIAPTDGAPSASASSPAFMPPLDLPGFFAQVGSQFHEFLMQAPFPFVLLEGTEHRMTFINPPYLRIIGRFSPESVLGKPIREALPELEGQPFYGLLDKVFRTGVPFIGIEVPARLQFEADAEPRDCFFDFIYHPVRGLDGAVTGIMVQATEVTEHVLSRAVSEHREQRLYAQWAELEGFYKTTPWGIALLEAKTLRILRINEAQASFFGSHPAALEGTLLAWPALERPALTRLLEEVRSGVHGTSTIFEPSKDPRDPRTWLVQVAPLLSPHGTIENLCVTSVEIPASALSSWPRHIPGCRVRTLTPLLQSPPTTGYVTVTFSRWQCTVSPDKLRLTTAPCLTSRFKPG